MPRRYAVRFTDAAETDLDSIFEYLWHHESLEIAERWLTRIQERAGSLSQFPERGSIPAELASLGFTGFRQTLLSPYRILYEVAKTEVVIVLIADGRRDMKALLESRLLT